MPKLGGSKPNNRVKPNHRIVKMPSQLAPPHSHRRRFSTNSLEGEVGQMRTSRKTGTLHGDMRIRDRLHHFTWAWFTATMATGGISLILSQTPHRFNGLTTIGIVVFLFDLATFITFCTCIAIRFTLFPYAFMASLAHPTESLFFPSFWISISNILSGITIYGIPKTGEWLVVVMRVLFWTYTACTFLVAVGQYFFLFTGKPLTIQSFTPAWILPIFPIMLSGTLSSLLGPSQPPEHALPIFIAGVTFQGLGMLIATFFYGAYVRRLMTDGLPSPNTRPGMFIAVGPPSFTALALLGISQDLARIFPAYTTIQGVSNPEIIADVFRILALSAAVFLWATAFWFFSIAVVSVLHGALTQRMGFHLVWWAFVFPNVGLTISTIKIGKALSSEGVLWVASVMTILLVITWLFVGCAHIRAVWKRHILWPGKDEDHEE